MAKKSQVVHETLKFGKLGFRETLHYFPAGGGPQFVWLGHDISPFLLLGSSVHIHGCPSTYVAKLRADGCHQGAISACSKHQMDYI